ncbi:putative DNA binding domain-containing protein [Mucilaginibacter sp. BJC16-A38]|uniref:AlbA family DNA-binding domain-containing protein n=1 Tax=Mucilaginibacter phenanthrenivorans TaxID=1234842 RepID=UPI002157CD58|nr:ATP-binding protein [Mucilaginibacter phenanthrenivorans]MCR8559672.1 putative DNA binding domain-containing protein [Mucilaginibacter phenanthrenivorans]
MNQDQIIKQIEPIIAQSIDGQAIENLKIDCKSKWWDLKSIYGLNEFLKDTCAIANTFGLDGFIIIGFDDKTNSFTDTKFSDSGLKDSAELRNVLIKRIDIVFDLNTFDITISGHQLSIIHIPPSVDKPHILRVYKRETKNGIREEFNKIFIRKNSSNYDASKNDIDIMYYDRKNIIPEYKIIVGVKRQTLQINGQGAAGTYNSMNIQPTLTFENQGSRPLAIVDIELKFSEEIEPRAEEEYTFKMVDNQPILVAINDIINYSPILEGIFSNNKSIQRAQRINLNLKNVVVQAIVLTMNSGKVISLPLMVY